MFAGLPHGCAGKAVRGEKMLEGRRCCISAEIFPLAYFVFRKYH